MSKESRVATEIDKIIKEIETAKRMNVASDYDKYCSDCIKALKEASKKIKSSYKKLSK